MMKERIKWIDAMKGFGIIMVVFSHVYVDFGHAFLNSFKMPLFFFCSGYVTNYEKFDRVGKFVKHRFVSLLYPYFVWSFLLFLFWLFFDREGGNILKNLIGIGYSSGGQEYMDWGVIMWFIPSLFVVEVIHAYINLSPKRNLLIMVVSIIGYLYTYFINKHLPWSINISMIMLIFYHLGYVWKKSKIHFSNPIYLPILLAVWFITTDYNGDVLVYQGKINNSFFFLISGVSGLLAIKLLVELIQKVEDVLAYIGKRVILVFLGHLRLITILKVIQLYVFNIEIKESLLSSIIYTVISVCILALVFDFVNKKLPWLLKYDKAIV